MEEHISRMEDNSLSKQYSSVSRKLEDYKENLEKFVSIRGQKSLSLNLGTQQKRNKNKLQCYIKETAGYILL
jgi:hypothetical protein